MINAKFKVGDMVTNGKMIEGRILDIDECGLLHLVKGVQVSRRSGDETLEFHFYALDPRYFELMVEPVTYPKILIHDGMKVVWNPPYTIVELRDNWGDVIKTGKTKCDEFDEYDEREGYLRALAKMHDTPFMKRYFRGKK